MCCCLCCWSLLPPRGCESVFGVHEGWIRRWPIWLLAYEEEDARAGRLAARPPHRAIETIAPPLVATAVGGQMKAKRILPRFHRRRQPGVIGELCTICNLASVTAVASAVLLCGGHAARGTLAVEGPGNNNSEGRSAPINSQLLGDNCPKSFSVVLF